MNGDVMKPERWNRSKPVSNFSTKRIYPSQFSFIMQGFFFAESRL